MRIAILGSGNIGGTLGRGWAGRGHEVFFGVRRPDDPELRELVSSLGGRVRAGTAAAAADWGEVVVLAVPWAAAGQVLDAAGDLAGKVLVDCTNPIGPGLTSAVEPGTSAGQRIAARAAGARTVKAFNTAGYGVYADPRFGDQAADLYLCGDDAGAKEIMAGLARDLGLEPVDCGPLAKSELLESLARLWISLAMQGGAGREIAFKLLRR